MSCIPLNIPQILSDEYVDFILLPKQNCCSARSLRRGI